MTRRFINYFHLPKSFFRQSPEEDSKMEECDYCGDEVPKICPKCYGCPACCDCEQ